MTGATVADAGIAKPAPTGTALTKCYWEYASRGQLLIQRCAECGLYQHYPAWMCRSCWAEDLAWVQACGTGTVWTFTTVGIPGHPGWRDETPYVLALVELDEGPRLMTNIVDCPVDVIHVGQRVQLVTTVRDGQPPLQFRPATNSTNRIGES